MTADKDTLKLTIAAGTYDGVLAGWELRRRKLTLNFAAPVHGGSVRGLSLAATVPQANQKPHRILVSCGYDEYIQTHDFSKRLTSSGQLRTPPDFGTPLCLQYAPPHSPLLVRNENASQSTHCLVGFSSGKLVIYKKKDWSLVHVLAGHVGGVSCVAVHPSGKLALSGGRTDGKLHVWDLLKGRLAFCHKTKTKQETIETIVWNDDGSAYGFCHGKHVTVREVDSGKDLLDVELPCRVNQICLMQGTEGLFVVVAGNDGSLPVLKVGSVKDVSMERRGMMAIEPVDSAVAGEERFKCIHTVTGYTVVTANSAGVVSVMDLQGAVTMICDQPETGSGGDGDDDENEESPVHPESDEDDQDDNSEGMDLAVDLIDSIQLGSGARITCLAAWLEDGHDEATGSDDDEPEDEYTINAPEDTAKKEADESESFQRKRKAPNNEVLLSEEALEKARRLVADAKKIQQRKERKRHKQSKQTS